MKTGFVKLGIHLCTDVLPGRHRPHTRSKVDANPPLLPSTSSHTAPNVFSLVLGLEAVVAISMQTALVLNGLTLAKILNGDITT